MIEEESNVEKFLMELFDDDVERKIVRYISQNKSNVEIIDLLLDDLEASK